MNKVAVGLTVRAEQQAGQELQAEDEAPHRCWRTDPLRNSAARDRALRAAGGRGAGARALRLSANRSLVCNCSPAHRL